jgi:hypothetical protein
MAITLTSSTPVHGSTDYFINKSVELIFNKAIDTTSLNNSVFSIIDIDSGTRLPLTVTASPNDPTKIILLPSTNLKNNTQYRVIVVGSDLGLGYALVAQDADTLSTSITVEFSSGTTVYKIDTTVEKETSSLTLEGDIFLPTNVKALGYDFTIDKVRPKNNKHGIATTLTGDNTIRFTFTKPLLTGLTDYEDWVDVSVFPLLDTTEYLASGQVLGQGSIPSYSVSVTGADLLVTFSHELPNNAGVQIDLLSDIESIDGDDYGGSMKYSINTALYPQVYGVEIIKREVKELTTVYNDDYIGAILFKNTIWSWERVGRNFTIDNIPFAAKQYIIYTTILDLMEDAEYTKYLLAGTKRQLGDLGVTIENLLGKVAMKVAKYQKAKEIAFESMIKGWQFRIGTSTLAYDSIASTINRLWYNVNHRYTDTRFSYSQDDYPSSNVSINRHARHNNPIW